MAIKARARAIHVNITIMITDPGQKGLEHDKLLSSSAQLSFLTDEPYPEPPAKNRLQSLSFKFHLWAL